VALVGEVGEVHLEGVGADEVPREGADLQGVGVVLEVTGAGAGVLAEDAAEVSADLEVSEEVSGAPNVVVFVICYRSLLHLWACAG
jgi:hypothetical protein